jgi:hypothetical protein
MARTEKANEINSDGQLDVQIETNAYAVLSNDSFGDDRGSAVNVAVRAESPLPAPDSKTKQANALKPTEW